MRNYLLVAAVILAGCETSTDDLQQYVLEVKAKKVPIESFMPDVKEFEHLDYKAYDLRSPFTSPEPEVAKAEVMANVQNCALLPSTSRSRDPLEQFSLSNLSMRGIMAEGSSVWALVNTPSGEIHRVRQGEYLGLHHGRIAQVTSSTIDIIEVIADGNGCWTERATQLVLSQNN